MKIMNNDRMLSQIDSFFVAYQERSGLLMQLGAELELKGTLNPDLLREMLRQLVNRWPQLGQTLRRRLFGVSWGGPVQMENMLHMAGHAEELSAWRNRPINPFREPPFQLLWITGQPGGRAENILAFRAHHSLLDGLGLLYICRRAMHFLADLTAGETPEPLKGRIPQKTFSEMLNPRKAIRRGKIKKMWGYLRQMSAEATAGRSARLAVRRCEPGDIASCEHKLDKNRTHELRKYAAAQQVSPLWLGVAAWMKAIDKWNTGQRGPGNSLISIEIPVSLRGKFSDNTCIGNFISPLVLFGDASQPTVTLAGLLRRQFLKGVKDGAHLAIPFFTAPGKYLPWRLYRRMVITPSSTGFATSHFTWFDQNQDLYEEISRRSGGTLEIVAQHIHAPVCLHMGAALFVMALPDRIQMSITHRLNALPKEDARRLMDLFVQELLPLSKALGSQETLSRKGFLPPEAKLK